MPGGTEHFYDSSVRDGSIQNTSPHILALGLALVWGAGPGCAGLQLTEVQSSATKPSNVAVYFKVETTRGEPVAGLAAEQFNIYGELGYYRYVYKVFGIGNDTPERLDEYVAQFGPDVIAITGEHPQLRALATQLGIHYNIPDHAPGEWYNVDHTVSVPVLDPQARWAGVLGAPHEAEGIRDALALRLVPGGNTRTGP